ncbi:hypothetical protein BH09MYX1_BH09MYX1_64640 [soil metagenome]
MKIEGCTPLLAAAASGSEESAKVLADLGADLSALDDQKRNAAALARGSKNSEPLVTWLGGRGVVPASPAVKPDAPPTAALPEGSLRARLVSVGSALPAIVEAGDVELLGST